LSDIRAFTDKQGIKFQYGDVLLIRSGWVDVYNKMDSHERTTLGNVHPTKCTFVGVEQTEEMLDFLHDNYFSAVAGDAPAFEAWPTNQSWFHHQYLLSLWGVPIGEMWDLEQLSQVCKRRGQYTFFFTSSPNNVAGKYDILPIRLSDSADVCRL
jgi:kynurenine formamidase